jgi:MFS-type transporter involved in bile tolerance (Atg22 family)
VKRILAWCLFDFANSAYSAVIVVTVFSVYYVTHIVGNAQGLGDLWWGRAISASLLLVVLTGPILGALADRGAAQAILHGVHGAVHRLHRVVYDAAAGNGAAGVRAHRAREFRLRKLADLL